MPTLKEKLEKEKQNAIRIYLYKEGTFWRAYGVSCVLFYRTFPHIKVLYNKNYEGYVFLGVPDSKIKEYAEKLKEKNYLEITTECNENMLVWEGKETISVEQYEQFVHTYAQKQRDQESRSTKILVISNERVAYLIEKIKQMPIDEITPVEALVKMKELKEYLHELGL